ncbi:MAG: Flp family type IVb pilin [Planctomycetota bacterium]
MVRFLRDEAGPTTVEYAILFLLIFLAVLTAITVLGGATADSFESSSDSVEQAFGSRP